MSTVQQLINSVDRWYPQSANSASDTDKVAFFNEAQDEISPYFGMIVENNTLTTVANQDYYAFPTGLTDISQIVALGIAHQATPEDRYDYDKYELVGRDDYPLGTKVYFQSISAEGVRKLVIQPTPDETGLQIKIRYRKALTELVATSLSYVPDFDPRFHDLLVWYCCNALASRGASADYPQADMFMQRYESTLGEVKKLQMYQKVKTPTRYRFNKQWGVGTGYAADTFDVPVG